eukprot:scaffold366669_cov20-Prasinocladus_malaysianus.AAC.1
MGQYTEIMIIVSRAASARYVLICFSHYCQTSKPYHAAKSRFINGRALSLLDMHNPSSHQEPLDDASEGMLVQDGRWQDRLRSARLTALLGHQGKDRTPPTVGGE